MTGPLGSEGSPRSPQESPLAQQFTQVRKALEERFGGSHRGRREGHPLMGLRETLTLKETLEAATPGPWSVHPEIARGSHGLIRGADGKTVAHQTRSTEVATLIALAPELAAEVLELRERHREALALCLEMGEWMRWVLPNQAAEGNHEQRDALLARLDQLGKEQT